jgi:hypothetical protein
VTLFANVEPNGFAFAERGAGFALDVVAIFANVEPNGFGFMKGDTGSDLDVGWLGVLIRLTSSLR